MNTPESEMRGTMACPICGFDKPHHHPDEQVEAYRDDQIRRDGWTRAAYRNPPKSGWYLCLGVEVDQEQYGKKESSSRADQRWSQLWWFNWVRSGGEASTPWPEIQEVLYFDREFGWRLRNLLGNASVSGAESRFRVHAKPEFWRDLPARPAKA